MFMYLSTADVSDKCSHTFTSRGAITIIGTYSDDIDTTYTTYVIYVSTSTSLQVMISYKTIILCMSCPMVFS